MLLPQEARGSVPLGTTPETPALGGRNTKDIFSVIEEKWIVAEGIHLCPTVSFECQAQFPSRVTEAGHRRTSVQKRQVPQAISKAKFQRKAHKVIRWNSCVL